VVAYLSAKEAGHMTCQMCFWSVLELTVGSIPHYMSQKLYGQAGINASYLWMYIVLQISTYICDVNDTRVKNDKNVDLSAVLEGYLPYFGQGF
jgi:hypothetical protein